MSSTLSASLNNLGFILQVYGSLIIIPIMAGFVYGENDIIISLFLTVAVASVLGFLLSNLLKARPMDYRMTCFFIVLSYVIMGFIGCIPYIYLGQQFFPSQSVFESLSSGYFESVSGFTTTGMSTLNTEALPKSMILFRAITQWLGGISIVYFMLLLIKTPGTLKALGDVLGLERMKPSIRSTFLGVFKIYLLYTIIFTVLLTSLGGVDLFNSVTLIMTGISTAGFMPVGDLGIIINPASYAILMVVMLVGALNFSFHERLVRLDYKRLINIEVFVFLLLTGVSAILVLAIGGLTSGMDLAFHIVSAATTTGFQYINLEDTHSAISTFMLFLMFIGGSSFSTAGGVKILRFIMALKSVPLVIKSVTLPPETILSIKIGARIISLKDLLFAVTVIVLGITSIYISSGIISMMGYDLSRAFFEATSAFSNVGLSNGLVSSALPSTAKWVLAIQMIFGKVEVIAFLIFIKSIIDVLFASERRRFSSI